MDSFEKISKMNLADLERKGFEQEENDGSTAEPEVVLGDEIAEDSQMKAEKVSVNDKEKDTDAEADVEVTGEPKKMAEPIGRHYYVDTEITEKEFSSFLFAHNYRQPILILATIIGVVWPVMALGTGRGNKLLSIAMAAMFLIYFPLSIWRRGKTAVKKNPSFENTFHYMFDEWGVHLELGEEALDVEWKRVYKYMFLKSVVALYTGKANAFLVPTKDLGDQSEEVIAFLKEMKAKHR